MNYDSTCGAADPSGRIDQALVLRGLARSRAIARQYITQGRVTRNSTVVRKAAEQVDPADALRVDGELEQWVGRAAYKLAGAIEAFGPQGLVVAERRCLDVGASTGGFTQVLLAHGARHVTALDVGHGQLAGVVASDERVLERSGMSIRDVTVADLGEAYDLIVADLSFISLRLVLDRIVALLRSDGDVITLVKPQFEVGKDALGKTGVVRSREQRAAAIRGVVDRAREHQLVVRGLTPSPVTGGTGNQEYLLWLARRSDGMMNAMDVTEAIERATREQGG